MIKRDELLRTEEFWFETLQNEIYRMVAEYIEKEGMNQTQLAEKLGVTKGLVNQWVKDKTPISQKHLIELKSLLNKAS